MNKFLRFFSLTTASQLCLVVNQLVLLPLQLRIWGPQTTSHWLVVIAVANLATIADLGLRSAGHAQLLTSVQTGDETARREFQQIWTLTRVLMVLLTCALVVGHALLTGAAPFAWEIAVTVSIAIDTLIIIRGIWLDTLGHFNKVEALFLSLSVGRVIAFLIALLVFHVGPPTIAIVMLVSSIAGAAAQAVVLPQPTSLAFLSGGWRDLRWQCLWIVRYVVSEPATNWMRLSLPVIVLASISTPKLVTTYVALRALFGLARQVVSQLGRYASVIYAQRQEKDRRAAESIVIRFTLLSTLAGLAISTVVISDHGRLFRLWLPATDVHYQSLIALSFSAGALSYGYQIVSGAMTRSGKVISVAVRQYVYLGLSGAAAVIAWSSGSVDLYLLLLAVQEIVLAALFVGALGRRIGRASVAAFSIASILLALLWLAVDLDLAGLFANGIARAVVTTSMTTTVIAAMATLFLIAIDRLSSGVAVK